ncbi:MAG: UDP-N-acetylmuramoyl-L-alanine--D-glutamate ligase [Candidatus Saccharimonadales bacterium]
MNIAIIGYGEQGRSAYEYWSKPGNQITIHDKEAGLKLPEGVGQKLGPDHLKDLGQYDLIVRSPIVHPLNIAAANSPGILDKVTSVTNEFMSVSPTKNVIGVTGTKGKGTTSTLIAKMLEAAGKRVHLGGNIGTPPLDLLKNDILPSDYVVLELANFQIIDLNYSPHLAVCLMITTEHLDWHENMEEYVRAKSNMFNHQTPEDTAIYFASDENSKKIVSSSKARKIPYFEKPGAYVRYDGMIVVGDEETLIAHKGEVKLLGDHNLQNICAAITAVWQVAPLGGAIKTVISSFSGLEHRLELVLDLNQVKYYDDSFGTTPDTAIVAMQAFDQPKVMILGGSDKGAPFDKLADAITKNNVRHVIAIGQTGPVIAGLLRQRGFDRITEGPSTITEIVDTARKAAQPGDVVLLSTGCASFGLFRDYKDRGEQFKKAVQSLQ